jgi:hypothetical protein
MRYIALVPILAITACTTPEQESPATAAPVPIELNCAAESVQYAIGQKPSAELGSKMVTESGSNLLRWLPPRSAVTMDYRQDRLNIAYNDDMVITRVNCG